MKTEHLDLEIKKLTHSQNYEGITETQQKRLNEFIDIKKQLALCSVRLSLFNEVYDKFIECEDDNEFIQYLNENTNEA